MDGCEGLGVGASVELGFQGLCSLHRSFQLVTSSGENAARAFLVARDMMLKVLHHFIALARRDSLYNLRACCRILG